MNGKGWKSTFNKPWFILQTKYLSSARICCAEIHRALTRGTLALGKASYHSQCITEVPHTAICIIWCVLPHMPLEVDTDEPKLVTGWKKVLKIRIWMARWTSIFSDSASHFCTSVVSLLNPWLHPQCRHTHSMLFWPSSLPLCEANIEANQEALHPRYLHAPFKTWHKSQHQSCKEMWHSMST